MQIRRLVLAVICAVMAGGVASVYADPPKYLIDHKGVIICVDEDSWSAHEKHGDTLLSIGCEVD